MATNPYDSIFDYEKLAQEEAARKQQLQMAQQKIQRTNALGESLRLIFDAVGGSQGASVVPRGVNPGIMQASQRYNQLEDQSQTNMDRLKQQKLGMDKAGIDYGVGLEAEQRKLRQDRENAGVKRMNELGDQATKFKQEKELQTQGEKSALERARIAGQYGVERVNAQTEGRLKTQTATRTNRSKKYEDTDLEFIPPGATSMGKIYLSEAEVTAMINMLALGKSAYDPALAGVIQALKKNEKVNPESIREVIYSNWDKVKKVLPEFAQAQQQRAVNSPLLPGGWQNRPQPYQQGKGPLKSFAGPAATKPIDIIQPDKNGNTDLSLLFN